MADSKINNETHEDNRTIEELQKLKNEGNKEYGKKNYKSALDLYAKSLDSVHIELHLTPPLSLIDGTDPEFYREILNEIELDSFLNKNRNEISKIFSNRAACYLNIKQYILCIHISNIALLYQPNNENALYRRAVSYEYLHKYAICLQNYKKLLQINDKHKKALDGMDRIQSIINKKTDRIIIYTESIDILKSYINTTDSTQYNAAKDDNKIIYNIGVIMNEICEISTHHQQIIHNLRFTHILYHFLLNEQFSKTLQIDCVHALNAIMKKITNNEKYSKQDELLVTNGFETDGNDINYIQSLIQISNAFLSKLIDIFETDEHSNNEKRFDENESLFLKLLLQYLINTASNQYLFEKYSDDILKNVLQYFKKLKYKYIKYKSQQKMDKLLKMSSIKQLDKKEKNENKKEKDDTMIISDVLVTILKNLSNSALRNNNENYKLLEKIRYIFFYQFLFTDFSKDLRIKNEIFRYFVCCSGLKSVSDQVNDKKLSSLKSEYEGQISEAVSAPIMNALKTKQFTSHNIRLVKALRALSIILQSNHILGEQIASKEDVLNCIVEVSSINESESDYKNTDNTDNTLDIIHEYEQRKENMDTIDTIGYLGCEVLALSCSNSAIRDAIIKSNNQHLFAWILDSDDLMVRAYAANAMAKFAAIDDDSRELALGGDNRCLVSCCGIMYYLLQNEDKTKGNKGKEKIDVIDDDEFRNYKLPLMNLCIETISYLSLHIETKLGLIANDNEMLKLLVSVSTTRYFATNRSLRHGLLTIVLNCCLSRDDVNRYMSDKEEQLHQLKKVVSKSLPNDPTKQDDIIQSRAGDKDSIKLIQRELIKENCIFLIYEIVRFTRKENKEIEDYVNSEIGFKERDEFKLRKRAEIKRKERYNFDPNKYKNETEKDVLQRKRLAHLTTQKTKYTPFELRDKLQMKISQVLMMIANIAEFRGNLVQQKAIRLSMDLFFENKHKMKSLNFEIRQMTTVTIARICISINPILLKSNDIAPICECLLKLIDSAQHELYVYEALLALCNISSLTNNGDDIKMDIAINKNGWNTLRNAFEEDHPLINAAILEIWCNLCTCFEAGIYKLFQNREVDIQIITLFLRHDSRRVQRAVLNILCIATSIQCDEEDDDDDDTDFSKEFAKEIAKNGGVLLLQCLLNIRQSTLIERFNKDKQLDKQNKEMDRLILERIRIVMANLERYGYTMRNIDQHGVRKDVLKDFQKAIKK